MAGNKKFIKDAIKRPGALTKAIGGKPSEHEGKVKKMEKGNSLKAKEARFYENVLKPAAKKKKK